MKLVIEIPDEAIKLLKQDAEKYLGPLLISFGASLLAKLKDNQETEQDEETGKNN